MNALIALSAVLAAALICVVLAAYDMIRQLCEDLDDARAERDAALAQQPSNVVPFRTDQKDRIAGMVAANQAKRTDWAGVFTTDDAS